MTSSTIWRASGRNRSGVQCPPKCGGPGRTPLPRNPARAEDVYSAYRRLIAPYGVGNRHPQFLGWVHGGGTAIGMLADMLAAGLNANCGGRDHAPIECERQVIRWSAEMLGLPADSSGLVLSGTSMANFVAVIVARAAALGEEVTRAGREPGTFDGLHLGRCTYVCRAGLRNGRVGRGCASANSMRRSKQAGPFDFAGAHRRGPGCWPSAVPRCRYRR